MNPRSDRSVQRLRARAPAGCRSARPGVPAEQGWILLSVMGFLPAVALPSVSPDNASKLDPLTRGIYVVRLSDPGQPSGISFDYVANPLDRSLVMFVDRSRLVSPVNVVISAGGVQRFLRMDTATGLLAKCR